MDAKELILWLEKNQMIRTCHDFRVNRNGDGWEQVHCEDCRVCQLERMKEGIFNGDKKI